MPWQPLPDDVPLDHEQVKPSDPDAALHSAAAGKDAPADMQTDAPGFQPLPDDAQLDQAAPNDQPGGFTDEQKQAILDYMPKAKDAGDLEQFASALSGGKTKIANAKVVLDQFRKGNHTFSWLNSIQAAPQKPREHDWRDTVGDSMVNAVSGISPQLGAVFQMARDSGAGKAFTEHAANATALDYGPEVGGFMDTLASPSEWADFKANLDRHVATEHATLQGDSADHPIASAGGELAGVGLTAPLTGAAGEAANLGKVGRAAQMVTEGAAYGSGAAGPGNRAEGAAIGAVAAPLLAGAGKVVAGLADSGKSVLSGSPGLARRIIAKAISADENTPGSVGADIAAAHANDVPMALGDTGENVRGLLAASSRASGTGRTIVRDALEQRQAELADRVTQHIERDLGPVANPHEVADQLMTQAKTSAAPIYDKFYSQPPVASPSIDALIQRPSMQKALKNAYTIAKEEGRDPEALGLRLGEDGNVQLENGPTLTATEASKANPNRFRVADVPNEMNELRVRSITSKTGRKIQFKGPIDMTQRLRMMGGIKEDRGELSHLGITNKPRRLPFGSNEQFLGSLVNNDKGMSLDDAAHALWEDGYFPDFHGRPTPQDLLERLRDEQHGTRYFDPADTEELDNFRRAQSSRYGMENAAAEGRPYAEDTTRSTDYQDAIKRQGPLSEGRKPVVEKTYTPQTLDYIKRGMDDVVEGYRDKTTGKLVLDTEGKATNNTLRSYMGVVDKLYPDYAQARAAYAGPVKGVSAMNAGRKALNMTADELEARMRDMSPFEKTMFAAGTRRAMAELVQSKGDTADVVNALVGTGKKRAMLGRLFGDRQQFQRFVDTLGQEKEGWRSDKQALLGSPTAANVSDDAALQTATMAADFMTTGLPVATSLRYAFKFGVGKLGEKAKQQVAALLSNTDPAAIRELAAELRAQAEKRGLNVRKVNALTRAGGNAAVALQPMQQAQ